MKALILSLMSFTFLTVSAHAEYSMVNCDSIRGTNRSLTLVVVNQDVKQVRVQTNGSRQRALIPNKILNQNIDGVTLYTVVGLSGFMEVENKVLEGNGGIVKLADDEFSCF